MLLSSTTGKQHVQNGETAVWDSFVYLYVHMYTESFVYYPNIFSYLLPLIYPFIICLSNSLYLTYE